MSLDSGTECFFDRGCGGDEGVDFGELEELLHVRAWRNGDDADAFVAATDEVADDRPQSGGVHLRDCGDVEQVQSRGFTAGRWNEFKDVAERDLLHRAIHVARVEWTGDAVDQGSWGLAFNSLNSE